MKAKKLRGIKAKRYNKERFSEKVQLRKKFKAFEEKGTEITVDRDEISDAFISIVSSNMFVRKLNCIERNWIEQKLKWELWTTGQMMGRFRRTC